MSAEGVGQGKAAIEGGARRPLAGWHFFVSEYGMVYRGFVFHDDGWHDRNGEYATTDRTDAKRVADERIRALAAPTNSQPASTPARAAPGEENET